MTAIASLHRARGVLLIACLVALVFANARHDSFHFDDDHSLVGNSHIRQLAEVPRFFAEPQLFSRNPGSEMYRPLVLVSYALTYHFSAYDAAVYHLGNIAFHLLATWALYGLYGRLGLRAGTALAAAALFAVHPLVGEPVNYVSSRSESMAALFFFAGMYCYVDDRRRGLAAALGCYAAALMCKSSAIVLPAVMLAYDALFLGWPRWRRLVGFAPLALGYLWLTSQLLHEAVIASPVRAWGQQLATQAKALGYYAKLLVFPHPLSVEHQFAPGDFADTVVWSSLAFVASLAFVLYRCRAEPLFWGLCAAAVLAPTALVPLNVLVNERRLYLALAAAIGVGAWLWDRGLRDPWSKRMALASGLALALVTGQRNAVWADEKRLWEDARDKAPHMVRPYVRLGAVYRAEGEFAAARQAYDRALALDPEHAPVLNNLGNLQRDGGDWQGAEASYRRALAQLPNYPEALINLATLLVDRGRFDEAMPLFERALAIAGPRVEIYNNMAKAHLQRGEFALAETALRRGLALGEERPGLYFNLGGALEGQGRVQRATGAYARALHLDSTYARAHYNLALLHEGAGARREAVAAYRAFLRHWRGDPRFAEHAAARLRVLGEAQ